MSQELKRLIDQWYLEKPILKSVSDRMLSQVKVMAEINSAIYQKCQQEGIDIGTVLTTEAPANNYPCTI